MAQTDHEQAATIPIAHQLLHNLGFFGHYLHVHSGGRSGKKQIMVRLLKEGGSSTQRELLDASCISSAALSEVLAKLESEGLIERERSEADRRQQSIVLSKAGQLRAQEMLAEKEDFENRAFSCLNEDETYELLELLERVSRHWQNFECKGGQS